jgi:hypothetical protein
MNKEKAIITALKIVNTCKKHGGEGECTKCPFNIKGCIATDGNSIPSDWRVGELLKEIK